MKTLLSISLLYCIAISTCAAKEVQSFSGVNKGGHIISCAGKLSNTKINFVGGQMKTQGVLKKGCLLATDSKGNHVKVFAFMKKLIFIKKINQYQIGNQGFIFRKGKLALISD